MPSTVQGVSVAQKCRRIHVLHGAFYRAEEGQVIGTYLCRYADGQSRALDIRYGWDVRCFRPAKADLRKDTQRSQIAWIGANPTAAQFEGQIGLYLSSYDNPRPEVEIASIDFVSHMTTSAPFLVALTIE